MPRRTRACPSSPLDMRQRWTSAGSSTHGPSAPVIGGRSRHPVFEFHVESGSGPVRPAGRKPRTGEPARPNSDAVNDRLMPAAWRCRPSDPSNRTAGSGAAFIALMTSPIEPTVSSRPQNVPSKPRKIKAGQVAQDLAALVEPRGLESRMARHAVVDSAESPRQSRASGASRTGDGDAVGVGRSHALTQAISRTGARRSGSPARSRPASTPRIRPFRPGLAR